MGAMRVCVYVCVCICACLCVRRDELNEDSN